MAAVRLGVAALAACAAFALPLRADSQGTAKATVTVDGTSMQFAGGECLRAEAMGKMLFSVNIGTHPGRTPSATDPDYFGATLPDRLGPFDDGTVSLVKDGKRHVLTRATGQETSTGATFSGVELRSRAAITGSFTC